MTRANWICALLGIACCVSATLCLSGVVLIAIGAEKSADQSKEFCEYHDCRINVTEDFCRISATVTFGDLITTVDRNINCHKVDKWQKQCNGGDAFCYKYNDKLYINKPREAMTFIYIGIAMILTGICAMWPVCIVMLLSCNMSEFD